MKLYLNKLLVLIVEFIIHLFNQNKIKTAKIKYWNVDQKMLINVSEIIEEFIFYSFMSKWRSKIEEPIKDLRKRTTVNKVLPRGYYMLMRIVLQRQIRNLNVKISLQRIRNIVLINKRQNNQLQMQNQIPLRNQLIQICKQNNVQVKNLILLELLSDSEVIQSSMAIQIGNLEEQIYKLTED
ncbi:unnamed protein product [Paramecium octaurelia]|uniref:Transmembrane protein n=1 Tax=Paramecium octaurelia TaxID=43137 RepID=A0A8S1UNE7_PAROT|nr:unnamed protein product [Paramecium octaurelia]